MKAVRRAIKAALSNPALVKRAAKDAAESIVRGAAWREADKIRAEAEAEEKAENPAEEATEPKPSYDAHPTPPRSIAPTTVPSKHNFVSPQQMATGASRKR